MTVRSACLSCLLAATLPAAAAAAKSSRCTRGPSGDPDDIPTMREVTTCQQRAIDAYVKRMRAKGRSPSVAVLERMKERQRDELRAFLEKHPEAATLMEGEKEREDRAEAEDPEKDFVDYFRDAMGYAGAKFRELFGLEKKKVSVSGSRTTSPEAAALLKKLETEGFDEASFKRLNALDPALARQHLKQSVDTYNKQLEQNLDPAMKKYWKKPGED